MEVDQVVAVGGVLLIVFTVMGYNHLQVVRAARRPPGPAPASTPASMLGRYASHRGHVVGQVVALASDKLVLRQGATHNAVPLSQAHAREGDIVLEGDVDWAAAADAGRAWTAQQPGTPTNTQAPAPNTELGRTPPQV